MIKVAIPTLIFLMVSGCRSMMLTPTGSDTALSAASDVAKSQPLSVLSVIGGLCLLAGMALLVVTKGGRGWYPVIGGLILTVLNYMVAKYVESYSKINSCLWFAKCLAVKEKNGSSIIDTDR